MQHSEETKRRISEGHKAKGIKPPVDIRATGEKHHNWKGGVIYNNGYKLVKCHDPSHPRIFRGGYLYEHRHVMEQHLGRYLDAREKVHHIDGNITNNAIENLVLCQSNSEHFKKFHIKNALKALQCVPKERTSKAPVCPRCGSANTNSSGINFKCRSCCRSWSKHGKLRQ